MAAETELGKNKYLGAVLRLPRDFLFNLQRVKFHVRHFKLRARRRNLYKTVFHAFILSSYSAVKRDLRRPKTGGVVF